MPKNSEYQRFVDFQRGKIEDTLPKDKATTATPTEIGFWKRYQFTRAVNHAREGKATRVELHLVGKKEVLYPKTPKELRIEARRKHPQKLQPEFTNEQ